MIKFAALPPLALYVHLPWCVRKCPYCDFNSHASPQALPQSAYVRALVADLESQLPWVWGRPVSSVFIGGGTPSLFDPDVIGGLISDVRARIVLEPDAEITMEANPGTFEAGRFRGFRDAGVNRLSIGIQSFDDSALQALGRVHDSAQARAAAELALQIFDRVNLDLMFGLPGQKMDEALHDIDLALAMGVQHLSCYQLTIEPNTHFASSPPDHLPDDDLVADMQLRIVDRIAAAGLQRYEISAFASAGHACRHNLNYWNFGDYLGIGAGAHGKISLADRIMRTVRRHHPDQYMQLVMGSEPGAAGEAQGMQTRDVSIDELPFEFMLNALRLVDGVPASRWRERTGMEIGEHPFLLSALARAQSMGLMQANPQRLCATERGLELLSSLQAVFLAPS